MKKQLISAMIMALLLSLMFVGTAFAHGVDDQAADTPLGSQQSRDNAGDNFDDAIDNSDDGTLNAVFRNPTCAGHSSPNGIHPPGNP